MKDLLVEIGVEEMPHDVAPMLAWTLASSLERALDRAGIPHGHVEALSTPRRVAALVRDLAGTGAAPDTVSLALGETLASIPAERRMRWDASGGVFVRPVRSLVCLCGEEVVPVAFGGVSSSREVRPHRLAGGETIHLRWAGDYEAALAQAGVTARAESRLAAVRKAVEGIERDTGARAMAEDSDLAAHAAGAEHPCPVLCDFLAAAAPHLPVEVVSAALRDGGTFLPLALPDGRIVQFLAFRDGPPDAGGTARAGFERAARLRLREAQSLFEKGRVLPLAERVRDLRDLLDDSHAGTLWEKTARVRRVAGEIVARSRRGESALVDRAAFLYLADRATDLVRRFPRLSGLAGATYAKLGGEPEEVVAALREAALMRGSGKPLPQSDVGAVLCLAHGLDDVAWGALGAEANGGRESLSAQADALIRLAVDRRLDVDLMEVLESATELYAPARAGWVDVVALLSGRVRALLCEERGLREDAVAAAMGAGAGNPFRALGRAEAIAGWRGRLEFDALAAAFARLRKAGAGAPEGAFDAAAFEGEAERALWRDYLKAEGPVRDLLAVRNYGGAIERLLPLRVPIESYLERVPLAGIGEATRANRLRLIASVVRLVVCVGDLSALAGGREKR